MIETSGDDAVINAVSEAAIVGELKYLKFLRVSF